MVEDRKFIKIHYFDELKGLIFRLYTISDFLTTKPRGTNDMTPNEFFSANSADVTSVDSNDSSVKRSGEPFTDEKKLSQKKNIQKRFNIHPLGLWSQ